MNILQLISCLVIVGVSIASSFLIEDGEARKNAEVHPRKAMENEGLFQGDIMGIDPLDKNAIVDKNKLWTDGKVYFQISPELESIRGMIYQAVEQYKSKTNGCVHFIESRGNGNYIRIFRHYGCYSYVGMVGREQPLSLGYGCHYIGTIVHEMGHAIGLHHEQNRSDRDKYLKIHLENVDPQQRHNFKKLRPSQNFLMTPFDYESIMEYGHTAFSMNGKVTIETLNGFKLDEAYNRPGLSDYDTFIVNSLYSCPGYTRPPQPTIPDLKWDFENNKSPFEREFGEAELQIRSNGPNHYLSVGEIRSTHMRIITPEMMGGDQVCMKFRYKIVKDLSRDIYGIIYGQQNIKTINIANKAIGWTDFKISFSSKAYFRVYFDVDTNREESGSALQIDDFIISHNKC